MPIHPDNLAIDEHGNPLPYSPAEVAAIVARALTTGDIVAAVIRTPQGLCVQVLGEPSEELADVLETVARGYRRAVQGH